MQMASRWVIDFTCFTERRKTKRESRMMDFLGLVARAEEALSYEGAIR